MAAIADKDDKNETPEDLRAENEHLREQLRVKEEYIKHLEQKLLAMETNASSKPNPPQTSSDLN